MARNIVNKINSFNIGDTVESFLSEEDFKSFKGDNWVPMDGRSISGTDLYNIFGLNFNFLNQLNSPNENDGDEFGYSVAINGDYIVVGARYDYGSTDTIFGAGEAYVFKKDQGGVDNWGLIKILNSPNENNGDQFGYSVAIDGDYIVVGARVDDGSTDTISNAGEAYIFKKDQGGVDNWGLIKILNSPNENDGNQFGYSVAIDGDYIVVGASYDDGSTDTISNVGEAYIFKKDQGNVSEYLPNNLGKYIKVNK